MPSFTKKAIMESFLHLIGKKQLDKITVRDLVDDCGVNRNTFYYYFQDIYAVLEEYCDLFVEKLPQNGSVSDTVFALFCEAEDFTLAHPRAAKSLAFSLGFEGLDRYLGQRLDPILRSLSAKNFPDAPSELFLRFLRYGLIGLGLDILRGQKLSREILAELQHLLALQPPPNRANSEI